MFIVTKSRPELKMGHVGSNTRSLGQFLEKPCVLSRRHSFDPIFMKLCQNDFLTLNSPLFSGELCCLMTALVLFFLLPTSDLLLSTSYAYLLTFDFLRLTSVCVFTTSDFLLLVSEFLILTKKL